MTKLSKQDKIQIYQLWYSYGIGRLNSVSTIRLEGLILNIYQLD